MTRALHHVGSLPPRANTSDTAAMTWFLDHSQGHDITALPASQPSDWTVTWLDERRYRPAFRVVGDEGDYEDGYDRFRAYAVRWGRRLRPEDVAFDTVARVREQMQALLDLREQRPDANRPLLISVPHPIDLAFLVFGGRSLPRRRPKPIDLWRIVRYLPVFTRAVVDFVKAVLEEFDSHDVVFQLETPTALALMHKAEAAFGNPAHAVVRAAALHARHTARLLGRFPVDARVILHLCYGDWKHEPIFRPRSLAYPAVYLNTLALRLRRAGYLPLPEVHIPVVWAEDNPVLDEKFYLPMATLDPAWRRVIAGVATEVSEQRSVAALRLLESALRRRASAVAPACGHGRRTVDAAERCVAVQIAAAGAPDPDHDDRAVRAPE